MGVSNFNAARVRNAARVLSGRGTALSSNQVQYSLLYRAPERNGGERARGAAARQRAGRDEGGVRTRAPPWRGAGVQRR